MSNSATYSPDDNKLRLYVGRVPRDEYEALRKEGWVSTPKQSCDFVATWTPTREDTALSYLDEGDDIEVEEYGPEERAADRAERFEGYREKRIDEATGHADTFAAGPSVFGHQNAARAQRQANRHDRHRGRALSQWSKAEYWQRRISGVIGHALYKSSAEVRRSRILRLEAEERKQLKSIDEYTLRYNAWKKVLTLEGADETIKREVYQPWENKPEITSHRLAPIAPAGVLAYRLANSSGGYFNRYNHPRRPDVAPTSIYDLLIDPTDPITPREAATLWLSDASDPADPESWSNRWRNHYANRLAFERALLAEEGGTAAEAEMEPGGWIMTSNRAGAGWKQIHSVHRSPVTKLVTSVKVEVTYSGKVCLTTINVQRAGEDCYRAPTDEEREAFKVATKERKAKAKAEKPATVPTINPTDADAERIQAAWNAERKAKHEADSRTKFQEYRPTEVMRMTQAEYSAYSKRSGSSYEIRDLHADDKLARRFTGMWTQHNSEYDKTLGAKVCKLRIKDYCGGHYSPAAIIILTDKPQKPIPAAPVAAVEANAETLELVEA